jgi:hypothetical protein
VQTLASIAAIGFLGIAAFQAALALGAPWGHAAWGGRHAHLPMRLRIGSAVAVVVWILAALVVLERGRTDIALVPDDVERVGVWVLVVLLTVGTIMNLASSSPWERFMWAPVAALLAILTLVVALG